MEICQQALQMLENICTSSGEILAPIIRTLEPMRRIAQEMDDVGRGMALSVNPTVAMAIEDLKVLYHTVDCKARLYVISCKDIAYYVCESGVVQTILDDLEKHKSTKELSYFFDDMIEYLSGCNSSLEQFNETHTEFQRQQQQYTNQWGGEARAKEKEEKKNLFVSRGFGISGATLGAGSVALAVASTIMCPPVALALAAGALTGSATSFGLAWAFAIERGISDKQKMVFEHAAKQACELYKELTDVRKKIDDMKNNLIKVKAYIGGDRSKGKGLTELVDEASSGGRLNRFVIESVLKSLREHMANTLKDAREYLNKRYQM